MIIEAFCCPKGYKALMKYLNMFFLKLGKDLDDLIYAGKLFQVVEPENARLVL